MKTKVSDRGQITLPKSIRTDLGIHRRDIIDFIAQDGKIIGIKKEPTDSIIEWRGKGILPKSYNTVDEYLREIRG